MKKPSPVKARRDQPVRRGSASSILRQRQPLEDYFTPEWMLLGATYFVVVLIAILFTPYTHQLDEIKNVCLRFFPPFLLMAAIIMTDFTRFSWKTHASSFFLGLFTLSMVVAFLLNPYKLAGERVVWFNVACITFTVLFAWFMNTENKMRKTMMFYVLISFSSVALGLFMFAGLDFTNVIYQYMKTSRFWLDNPEWITLFYTLKESKSMYSWILNEDFYAAYLIMMTPMAVSMFFVEDRLRFKVLGLMTSILMLVCLALTNSNDSYMSFILGVLIYGILGYFYVASWHLTWRFVITAILCLLLVFITVVALMYPVIVQTWAFKADALEGRKILWLGGFWPWLYGEDITRSSLDFVSIIFGTGPGGYHNYFPLFRRPDFFDNQINNVTTYGHNYYLDVLLEMGLFGLITFMAFYLRVLYDGIQQIRFTQNRYHKLYQLACVTGLISIALQNFFSPNNRWAVCGMIYYTLFGLSMGLHHLDKPGEPRALAKGEAPSPAPMIGKLTLAVFALIFILRSPWQARNYWIAARANNNGLRAMEYAEAYPTREQEFLVLARSYFDEAIRHNPTFVTSYYKMGNVLNQLGESDNAIKTYERLNEIVPHYSEIHLNLGIMYSVKAAEKSGPEQLKLMEDAYTQMKEAAREELKPNVQKLAGAIGRELAQMYETLGRDEDALKIYNEIKQYYRNLIEYEPRIPEYQMEKKKEYLGAQRQLIQLAYMTEKTEEAQGVLEKMYWENPAKTDYLRALIAHYDNHDQLKEKVEFLEKASHNDPLDAQIRLMLAEAYQQSGQLDKYRTELKRIEVIEPTSASALSRLYLDAKAAQSPELESYKAKLESLGINADTLTTAVEKAPAAAATRTATSAPLTTQPATAMPATTAAETSVSTSPVPAPATAETSQPVAP